MAQLTCKELIQAACYEAGIPAPSAVVAATDVATLKLKHLFYATGRELRRDRCWSHLKRSHTIYLQSQQSKYKLPQDFFAALPGTHYDKTNSWQLAGPGSDVEFDYRLHGIGSSTARKAFRVFGPAINPNSTYGQLEIDPVPGAGDQDTPITFEYITKTWMLPAHWVSGGTVGATDSCNSSGNIYTHGSGITNGTVPPNMAYGVGQDGGVMWKAISPSVYAGATVYLPGAYITTGGNLYYCTVGGTSSSAPTSTTEDTDITDGTVTWRYKPFTSGWTGATAFSQGDHLKIGSQYYRAVLGGITGNVQPTWTTTTVSDGTITWTFQEAPQETLVADTDLCLFDDELMIMGLKWRFLRAHNFSWQEVFAEYEDAKDAAGARWNQGRVLDLASGERGVSLPNIGEGNFG